MRAPGCRSAQSMKYLARAMQRRTPPSDCCMMLHRGSNRQGDAPPSEATACTRGFPDRCGALSCRCQAPLDTFPNGAARGPARVDLPESPPAAIAASLVATRAASSTAPPAQRAPQRSRMVKGQHPKLHPPPQTRMASLRRRLAMAQRRWMGSRSSTAPTMFPARGARLFVARGHCETPRRRWWGHMAAKQATASSPTCPAPSLCIRLETERRRRNQERRGGHKQQPSRGQQIRHRGKSSLHATFVWIGALACLVLAMCADSGVPTRRGPWRRPTRR
mmetsp:Transcript_109613/g.309193  ORF Transcript_109613/g.309193 Transcript_109613/m.309193 type:complete len:277 (-) Transcript_109613:125-955(-)